MERIKSRISKNDATTPIGRFIIDHIYRHRWTTQSGIIADYPKEVSRQYISQQFDKLLDDNLIKFVGSLGRKKYYVLADSEFVLADIRRTVQATVHEPRPTIWMGAHLSPVSFLVKFNTYEPPFGDSEDYWNYQRDIKPELLKLLFADRGGHNENELIAARGIVRDYVEMLHHTANFLNNILDNNHVNSGAVAAALPDLTVLNYLDRHLHEREIA